MFWPTQCCRQRRASAKLPPLPSCRRGQAGRRHHAATTTLPLPTPPPCCCHRQFRALAKLPPPPPSWPPPLTPHSHQAAAAAAKLAAAPALSLRFCRHHCPLRSHRHRCCCHRCHFCAFSRLLIVCAPPLLSPPCAPTIVVGAGVFFATVAAGRGGSMALVAACAAIPQ